MVYTCFLCKWRSDRLPQRSYHKFPLNKELKQKWLDILGKSNVSIGKRTSLCALHFEEHCFRYGLVNGRKILKDGSLPTLHLINNNAKKENNDLVFEIKVEPKTESNSDMEYPTTYDGRMNDSASELDNDNHWMKPSTSELNVEKNFIEVEINPLNGSSSKSSFLNEESEKDEILYLKKKVLTLEHTIKHLRNSKNQMKLQITELTKKLNKYEAENKLMHVSALIGQTVSNIKQETIE